MAYPEVYKYKKRASLYDRKDIRDVVLEERDKGLSWEEIIQKIKEKFGVDTSTSALRKIYDEEIAKKITIDKKAGRTFKKYEDSLHKLFGESVEILKELIENIKTINNELKESDMTDLQAKLTIMKMLPQIKGTIDMIFSAIKVMQEQQERIRIEQSKLAFSVSEVNEQIYRTIRVLAKEGYIKILKKLPDEE